MAPTETAVPRARDLAAQPAFLAFLVGNGVSAAGTHFQTIAQSVLMYRLTDSTFLVGITVLFQFAGVFACAPYAGAAADRFDRRTLLAWLNSVSCVLNVMMAVLVGTGSMTPGVLLVFVLATGVVHSFTQPVLQSFVPQLVSLNELTTAVSLSNTSFTVARTLGPIAAAGTIAAFGLTAAFAVNAGSYLIFLGALTMLHPRSVTPDGQRRRFRDGVAVARRDPAVFRALLVLVGIVAVTEPVTTLAPELTTSAFGASDAAVGLLLGAFGVGATLAGMLLGRFRRDAQIAMATGFFGASVGLVGLALSPHLVFALVSLVAMGAGYLHCVTTAMTVLLARTPPAQHGLIMAIWSIAFFGSRPFAAVAAGALAALTSARWASLALGLTAIAFGVLVVRKRNGPPSRRRRARPQPVSPPAVISETIQ